MRRPFIAALAVLAVAAPALASDPPYLPLAKFLGTPHLASATQTPGKTQMLLKFVPGGQSATSWKKLSTFSILKVPAADTDGATRGVIVRYRDALRSRHAKIATFDENPLSPANAYFEFSAAGESHKGVVYSPHEGFVTVIDLAVKNGGAIGDGDVTALKKTAGRS